MEIGRLPHSKRQTSEDENPQAELASDSASVAADQHRHHHSWFPPQTYGIRNFEGEAQKSLLVRLKVDFKIH